MTTVRYEVAMSSEQYGHEMFGTYEGADGAADALSQARRLVTSASREAASDGIARDIHISVLPVTETTTEAA